MRHLEVKECQVIGKLGFEKVQTEWPPLAHSIAPSFAAPLYYFVLFCSPTFPSLSFLGLRCRSSALQHSPAVKLHACCWVPISLALRVLPADSLSLWCWPARLLSSFCYGYSFFHPPPPARLSVHLPGLVSVHMCISHIGSLKVPLLVLLITLGVVVSQGS